MAIGEVNEASTAYLTVTCRDRDSVLATPASLSYRVDCVTTGAAVRATTSVTPGSEVEITLTPADTAIQAQENISELRRVTVIAGYGVSDQVTADYDFLVRNLRFYS